ncbi:Cytosolic Fe-S cluster assembly factor NBP35 [Psidium guajava]|nr:Cytosolic Fe-S cluster assembly factor NBP35 [Psidium guajava]
MSHDIGNRRTTYGHPIEMSRAACGLSILYLHSFRLMVTRPDDRRNLRSGGFGHARGNRATWLRIESLHEGRVKVCHSWVEGQGPCCRRRQGVMFDLSGRLSQGRKGHGTPLFPCVPPPVHHSVAGG